MDVIPTDNSKTKTSQLSAKLTTLLIHATVLVTTPLPLSLVSLQEISITNTLPPATPNAKTQLPQTLLEELKVISLHTSTAIKIAKMIKLYKKTLLPF
jgi:hypothetical protein